MVNCHYQLNPYDKEAKVYKAITDVKPLENYKLLLSFDKEKRELDMQPFLNKGKYKELQDKNLFKKVFISFDTIAWENKIDLDPEFAYQYSKPL